MTIDQITINLYTCCKCLHRWTNWDRINSKDGPIPKSCPKCRNVRWNQFYTEEDFTLFRRPKEEHIIEKNAGIKKRFWGERTYDCIDFIAYDWLYTMTPSPEPYEIREVMNIPISDIETRHELMLSMIYERITNEEKYDNEYFSKYGRFTARRKPIPWRGKGRNNFLLGRRMPGCNHKKDAYPFSSPYRYYETFYKIDKD